MKLSPQVKKRAVIKTWQGGLRSESGLACTSGSLFLCLQCIPQLEMLVDANSKTHE